MWGGIGDTSNLASGARGFAKTSMSAWIGIQPALLLQELPYFASLEDGYLARHLIWSIKPSIEHPDVIEQLNLLLKNEKVSDFHEIMLDI